MNKLATYIGIPALLVTHIACEVQPCTYKPEQYCKISITTGSGDGVLDKFSGGQIDFKIENLPFNQNVSIELNQSNNNAKLAVTKFDTQDDFYRLYIASTDLEHFSTGPVALKVTEQGFVGYGQFVLKEKKFLFALSNRHEVKPVYPSPPPTLPTPESWGVAAAGIVALSKPTIIRLQNTISSSKRYVNLLAYDTDFNLINGMAIALLPQNYTNDSTAPSLVDIRKTGFSVLVPQIQGTTSYTTIDNCLAMGSPQKFAISAYNRGMTLPNASAISVTEDGKLLGIAPYGTSTVEVSKMETGLPTVSSESISWKDVTIMKWIDLDEDATPELLIVSPTGNDIQILKKDQHGKYAVSNPLANIWKSIIIPQFSKKISALAVGDINGDSVPDLAVARGNAVSFVLISKERLTRFIDSAIITRTEMPNDSDITSLALGDLDGDGRADLLIAKPGDPSYSGWMYWYKNESSF